MTNSIIDKLFFDNAYGIAYREIPLNGIFDNECVYISKYPTIKEWFADPFIIEYQNEKYIFAETMNYKDVYGKIGVAKITNKRIGPFKTVIKEPFHMSFPNVFYYRDSFYMIPETKQSKQLRLYKAKVFPYEWQLEKILIENVKYVDSALIRIESKCYIFSYDTELKQTVCNVLDMGDYSVDRIKLDGVCAGRGAGNFFFNDGYMFRTVQNCEKSYGDFVEVYKVEAFSPKTNYYKEKKICNIKASDLKLDNNMNIQHCHTFNVSKHYQIVDFNYRKFYINKFMIRFWQKVIMKERYHKRREN